MTRRAGIALAALALLAGAGCVLLGRSVLSERTSLARADASLAAPAPTASVARGGGVAGLLLGTGDDRAARAAAADYVQARAETALAPAVRGRAQAASELAPLALDGPAARRSWAATLLAVLELDQSRLDMHGAQGHVKDAIAALGAAVAADPANENAKRDLELLLTLQQQGKGKQKSKNQKQQHAPHSRHGKGRARAASSPPGSGW